MNTKLFAAFAFGAALALGACSGGAPATTTTPDSMDPGTTDPTDPAAPDDRTAAQTAFDTALENAETALTNAQRMVTAAVAAATAADTDEARTAAQEDIDEARTALMNAVTAARGLTALAPDDDFDRLGKAGIHIDKAELAQTADLARLRSAESRTGWSGSDLLARTLAPWAVVDVTRTERIKDSKDVATRLKADALPPVMYESGKVVLSGNLGSSGDRLRMRGIPVRFTNADGILRHSNSSRVAVGSTHNILAGLTITPSGLVIDLGGDGARSGSDLRISYVDAGQIEGSTSNAYDLNLDFGRPSASPTGNAEYYWEAALMPTDAQAAATYPGGATEGFKDGTRNLPIGTYYVRLSNHLGVDRNKEDPDDPVKSAEDDTNSYMTYAAYGLFDFLPRNNGNGDQIPASDRARAGRVFPFHVGYDAFKDATGMKVTDVAEADEITRGKFKGRTVAQELLAIEPYPYNVKSPAISTDVVLLRGDIELTATISRTQASNKISGTISNLESWDNRGYWEDYARITGNIALNSGDIKANGSFAGVVADPDAAAERFAAGTYRGSFYGPLSSLEAAGAWLVNYDPDVATSDQRAIVGGFGAALVHNYGEANERYGRVVGPDGN